MLSSKLRNIMYQYIDNDIDIEALEIWYVSRLPILLADPLSNASDLVSAIELGLAEYSAGIRDEAELRQLLATTLQETVDYEEFNLTDEPVSQYRTSTGTSSTSEIQWSKLILGPNPVKVSASSA